ncbi:MAG: response regulator [Lysobacterales bacterium]
MQKSNDFLILIVDDDALDVEILCHALAKIDTGIQTIRCVDGQHALEVLHQSESDLANRRVVVFLDINMPRMDGMEFLARIRTEPQYSGMPVLVFSTSDQRRDIEQANQFNFTGYITKLPGVEETQVAMKSVVEFLNLIEIPRYKPPTGSIEETQRRPSKRILIVDDDEIDVLVVKKTAANLGVASDWVLDKEEALAALSAFSYDGIVTDFRLGIGDADELVEAIDEHPQFRAMPVLVVSGTQPPSAMMRNIEARGAQVFIKDDLAAPEFSDALAKALLIPLPTDSVG